MTEPLDMPSPEPRDLFQEGLLREVNWLGLWTLYGKEVHRFLKITMQTVAAPVISSLLLFTVFTLALGTYRGDVNGIPFADFLAPGLIMMTVLTNAFSNTSSSLLMSKMQGNLVDFLMPPLSPAELTIGFVMGGVTRGVLVALATALALALIVDLSIAHLWAVIYYVVSASFLMSAVGVITGAWAEKFDHLATITNFIIMPLAMLSGTFYSIEILPPLFALVTQFNPFFYMIDGFRYGFIGGHDGPLLTGAIYILTLNIIATIACYTVFRTGYRLKT